MEWNHSRKTAADERGIKLILDIQDSRYQAILSLLSHFPLTEEICVDSHYCDQEPYFRFDFRYTHGLLYRNLKARCSQIVVHFGRPRQNRLILQQILGFPKTAIGNHRIIASFVDHRIVLRSSTVLQLSEDLDSNKLSPWEASVW